MSLTDIAKRTGIPAPSARRYASLFRDFLSGRKLGRTTRYPEESAAVFRRIADLYAEGRVTGEIEDILRREYPRTIEVGPAPEPIALPASPPDVSARLAESLSTVLSDALSSSMSRFSEALERIAEQKDDLDSQQEDIAKLKNGFVLLARNLKRLARRDQADMTALVNSLSERVRSMEPKLSVMEEMTLTLSSENADLKARVAAQEIELQRLRADRDQLADQLVAREGQPE